VSQERAIKATFSDWRTVKSRKALQLVFEVPLEQQAVVLKMLGAPMPDAPLWCAIALLNPGAGAEPEIATTPEPQVTPATSALGGDGGRTAGSIPATGAKPDRRPWRTLPLQQRAGMLCADKGFQKWVSKKAGWECDEQDARDWLCMQVGVKSRSEIPANIDAQQLFQQLESDFMHDSGRAIEVR
jgi:hypothetical protein